MDKPNEEESHHLLANLPSTLAAVLTGPASRGRGMHAGAVRAPFQRHLPLLPQESRPLASFLASTIIRKLTCPLSAASYDKIPSGTYGISATPSRQPRGLRRRLRPGPRRSPENPVDAGSGHGDARAHIVKSTTGGRVGATAARGIAGRRSLSRRLVAVVVATLVSAFQVTRCFCGLIASGFTAIAFSAIRFIFFRLRTKAAATPPRCFFEFRRSNSKFRCRTS